MDVYGQINSQKLFEQHNIPGQAYTGLQNQMYPFCLHSE